jgi:hypothetical protein
VQNLKDLLAFTGDATDTFTLTTNLDFTVTALPTGFYIPTWAGTFDGANHTLSNFTLNNPYSHSEIGFFGLAQSGSYIKNLGLVNVTITGTSGSNVGGLVGFNSGTVSNSYATGSVSGYNNVGDLVGGNILGAISNSYATGSVSGSSDVGGLAGINNVGTISNSYATGSVSSTGINVGGLVGYNTGTGTITNSYWDITTSGQGTSAGGIGMTTAQMETQASFIATLLANGTISPGWNIVPLVFSGGSFTFPTAFPPSNASNDLATLPTGIDQTVQNQVQASEAVKAIQIAAIQPQVPDMNTATAWGGLTVEAGGVLIPDDSVSH